MEKGKFKHLGHRGIATLVYDPVNGRYSPSVKSKDFAVPPDRRVGDTEFDNTCWLSEKELFSEDWTNE